VPDRLGSDRCKAADHNIEPIRGPMSPITVVCCSEIADPNWRWIEPHLPDTEIKLEFVGRPTSSILSRFNRFNLDRLRTSLTAIRVARRSRAQVLVTQGPTLAAWCALIARIIGFRISILAHSFNFTSLPGPLKRSVFRVAFSSIERFVVYSKIEREIYSTCFGIPLDRFDFVRWGVRAPTVSGVRCKGEVEEYVSAIGGNARDYRSLIDAASILPDIRFSLVVRPDSLAGLKLPANVTVYTNIPPDQAMEILSRSRFMVLPLINSEVPCGHVTLVAAMHLGKAFIITDSLGVRDYVRDGENAITVAAGSAEGLARATRRLWQDQDLGERLAENGRLFAAINCSEEQIAEHFLRWIRTKMHAQ
jgi:glycosyltransferase involved in cell wall biosynthesis